MSLLDGVICDHPVCEEPATQIAGVVPLASYPRYYLMALAECGVPIEWLDSYMSPLPSVPPQRQDYGGVLLYGCARHLVYYRFDVNSQGWTGATVELDYLQRTALQVKLDTALRQLRRVR